MANEIMVQNNTEIANNSDFAIPAGFICTIDTETLDGKLALANVVNSAITMRDLVDTPIMVRDIITTPGVRSRTGEACTNCYLIANDGTAYFTQSDGIARGLKLIVGIFTDSRTGEFTAPCDMGVALVVKEQKLPNGNTLKTIVPVKS